MVKELSEGLRAYRRAHSLVFRHKLWPYLILPGLFSLIYFPVVIFFGYLFLDDFASFLHTNLIPGFLRWEVIRYILIVILWIVTLLLAYMSYKYVVLIICSPILGYLSEATEKILHGTEAPSWSMKGFMHDLLRALIINIWIIIVSLTLMVLAWLTVFIPVVGAVISPILMVLIQFYYTGCGLVDPTLERKRYSVRESLKFASYHRATMTGLGLGFTLLLMIPLIGWYLAPSYGAIAGTLASLELLPNSSDK